MKFHVKQRDEGGFDVEEVLEEKSEETAPAVSEAKDEVPALTSEEISALKGLAAAAPQLLGLLKVEHEEHADPDFTDADPDEDEDEDDKTMNDEEIIETDKKSAYDSKRSFGAIEKQKATVDDSLNEEDIEAAWAKRYGGTR